jgi:hypothetical protein
MAVIADENYGAMGGLPTGVDIGGSGMSPDQWTDFWAKYQAAQEQASRTSEMAKNVPAGFAQAAPVTPGPEAFKQHPTTGGGDLANMPVEPDFANRATLSAMYPLAGLAQLGGYLGEKISSAGGYYPNTVSEYARQGKEMAAKGADMINRANVEASRRAGHDIENFSFLHPIATAGNIDPANVVGTAFSPANVIPGAAGERVGAGVLSRFAGASPTAIKSARLVGGGLGMGFGTELANPITQGQVLPENATPEQRAQADRDFAMDKLKRLGVSTALGGVLGPVASEVAPIVGGKVAEKVALLRKEGVPLSIGQVLGGDPAESSLLGQLYHSLEKRSTSIPVVGLGPAGAYARANEGLNQAVAQRALTPTGDKLPRGIEPGRKMGEFLQEHFNDKYDNILPQTQARLDAPFMRGVQRIEQDPNTQLLAAAGKAPEMQSVLKYIHDLSMSPVGAPGQLTGQMVKDVQSNLAQWGREYGSTPGPENQRMAKFISAVRDEFMGATERHTAPDVLSQLKKVNQGYRTFVQDRDAGAFLGAEGGVYNANQFANAVKKSDMSVGKGDYRRGQVLNQDLSDAAKVVLSSERSSGTSEREAAGKLMHMIIGGHVNPLDIVGAVGTLGVYSRPGQWALRQIATNRLGMGKPLGALTERSAYGGLLASESPRGQEEIVKALSPSPGLIAARAPNAAAAGADFYSHGTDSSLTKRNLNAMTPSERAEFGDAYAKKWLDHIGGSEDSRTALNALDTPEGRLHMDTALGPNRSRQIEATARIEGLQSLAPWLANAENAKKTGSAQALPTRDSVIANAINTGASLTGKKFKPEEVLRVSALLASQHPEHYAKGIQQLSNSPMMDALRAYDKRLTSKEVGLKQGKFLLHAGDETVGAVAPGAESAQPVEGGPLGVVNAVTGQSGEKSPFPQPGSSAYDELARRDAALSAPAQSTPPVKGALQGNDGGWYIPNPNKPGKFLKWKG